MSAGFPAVLRRRSAVQCLSRLSAGRVISPRVSEGVIQIGELSRRTGLSPDVIRAWERRYGVLRPVRSEGNFRLYSGDDVARLRLMRHYTEQHISPSRAARLVLEAQQAALDANPGIPPHDVRWALAVLRESLERFDDAVPDTLLRRLMAIFTPAVILRDIVLPYLHEVGERWEAGRISVAQEHFASTVLERWMLSMAAGWGRSGGRRGAVLACVPGERHVLGLMAFGLVLRDLGWRITYLGGDTPLDALEQVAATVEADAVVLAAAVRETFEAVADAVGDLARRQPVVVGGTGVLASSAARRSLHVLPGDIVVAAQSMIVHPPQARRAAAA